MFRSSLNNHSLYREYKKTRSRRAARGSKLPGTTTMRRNCAPAPVGSAAETRDPGIRDIFMFQSRLRRKGKAAFAAPAARSGPVSDGRNGRLVEISRTLPV